MGIAWEHILTIVCTVLAVFAVWVMYELARTIRKARNTVVDLGREANELVNSANKAMEDIQPIIKKVDGMVTDLEPAVSEVQPLVEKTSAAIDVATVDLATVNDILLDVSSVTDTASNVTNTVSKAANSAVSGVAGVVGKFTTGKKTRSHRLGEGSEPEPEIGFDALESEEAAGSANELEEKPAQSNYVTYGSSSER